ncbi:hypothetical protein SAMN06265368_0609 [Cohaesibacter gelatinilyticus]|uniref:DUF3298 domain-containing protein n=2 Tax=Cohaesibacter gelatinilyticus TaxID=372072 RepID=A0A285NC12_9HYPH|nr:hypothetical protein SAMN06265368_0609 [Cohaesibacter gelatinilyticus]
MMANASKTLMLFNRTKINMPSQQSRALKTMSCRILALGLVGIFATTAFDVAAQSTISNVTAPQIASDFTFQPSSNIARMAQTNSSTANATSGETTHDTRNKPETVTIQSQSNSNILGPLKPFLLHSKDATITYLMPGAIVHRAGLDLALRSELENRALDFWQLSRQVRSKLPAFSVSPFLLRSRVEDRFQSSHYSSLYWQEEQQTGDASGTLSIHTLTYDHESEKVIGLQDLLGSQDDNHYRALLDLLNAYIRADIARQKSLRLGSSITPDQDAWLKEFSPTEEKLSTFNLVPSTENGLIAGLTFYFNPGLLGAEADGAYSVYVPSSIFATSLQPDYAANFGGEALKVNTYASNGLSSAMVHLRNLKEGDELAGSMVIEGEVPQNWCNGLHVTLLDGDEIVSEGAVTMEPNLQGFGLVDGMIRFRVEMDVNGEGGNPGRLTFEPYQVEQQDGQAVLKKGHGCDPQKSLTLPNPINDQISLSVVY